MEYKGQIIGFPKIIVRRMLECQEAQGNKRDVTVFENAVALTKFGDGFDWDKTLEGYELWDEVISDKNFELFFEYYRDVKNKRGDIADVPDHVLEAMMDEQERQGNKRCLLPFMKNRYRGFTNGGFDWPNSLKGHDFWNDVLTSEQYHLIPDKAESFPKVWCIEGDMPIETRSLPKDHWFYPLAVEGKFSGVSFNSILYYTWRDGDLESSQNIPTDATLVTKEQLVKHYKLNLNPKQNEEIRTSNTGKDCTRGSGVSSSTRPVTATGRLTGNQQTAKCCKTRVGRGKVSFNSISI